VTNVYDGFGRLTSSTLLMDSMSRALLHRYREDGNRTRVTHPDLQAFTYDYDALGRLSGVYEGIGTAVMLDQFAYSPQGLPASRTERFGSSVTYGYDSIGRLASLTDAFVGGTGNVALGFGYNPASQIVSRSRNNDAYASTTAYNVSRTYTVNGLNQYTAACRPSGDTAISCGIGPVAARPSSRPVARSMKEIVFSPLLPTRSVPVTPGPPGSGAAASCARPPQASKSAPANAIKVFILVILPPYATAAGAARRAGSPGLAKPRLGLKFLKMLIKRKGARWNLADSNLGPL